MDSKGGIWDECGQIFDADQSESSKTARIPLAISAASRPD
jgi:hypothetical protein